MLQSLPFSSTFQPTGKTNNLSRVLSAAVVSRNFKQRLLRDPVHAVNSGFINEQFDLTKEEMAKLSAIKADSLAEFALHIART